MYTQDRVNLPKQTAVSMKDHFITIKSMVMVLRFTGTVLQGHRTINVGNACEICVYMLVQIKILSSLLAGNTL